MFKNALVSCTNKVGLVEFLKPYVALGLRVVSTGGTAEHLRKNAIPVVEIFEQTGFPEVMDGRVRTLHPKVHMALLARAWVPADMELLKESGIQPFDLVVGNLYDFENYVGKGLPDSELIEHIDIGGPSFLRSAAKNFSRIAVVVDPADYSWISKKTMLTDADRKRLAVKVFKTTANYDQMIARELERSENSVSDEAGTHALLPVKLAVEARLKQSLRYGENPSQKAAWYVTGDQESVGLHQSEVLQGKELSYNNLLDLESAVACVRQFSTPTTVIVKHNNPCGVASDSVALNAVKKALASDPISAFGGIVAVNTPM
ncbi:MAG: bifunctional phosphoribosylaminoimidazolecarboxamide formyltransferase/IMP cyclohydrolase, partial [Bdellovibrionales bacterium]|nr:bifunctional phosphoribosylaminoimidazolecarboxamide formyltransferase/IMP cyclohydrolase [Bdellovibrionales bacterium]